MDLAKAHLHANGRPLDLNLESDMQEQLCKTLPPGWCSYDDPNRPRPTVSLDWGTVKNALVTFGTWIAQGCKFVDPIEADRRAEICSRCYLNVPVSGCAACQKLIGDTIGERKTRFDYALKGCAVCKCTLRAKVWFEQSTLDKSNEKVQSMFPSHCWCLKDGENYKPD